MNLNIKMEFYLTSFNNMINGLGHRLDVRPRFGFNLIGTGRHGKG